MATFHIRSDHPLNNKILFRLLSLLQLLGHVGSRVAKVVDEVGETRRALRQQRYASLLG